MNLRGEPAFVGRHCGSHEYRITEELVSFYRDALDDSSPLEEGLAPPLLFHSECYRFLGEWYLKNLFGNLHARQEWELFAPLRIGARVRSRSTIVARYSKRGRDYVVNETDLYEPEDGRLLVRGRTHQSFLPPQPRSNGFVVDEGTARRKAPPPPFPTAQGPELGRLEKVVDRRRCWMFSGPARNYHTDREEARKLGFPNIVVQGMMTTCFAAELMQRAFGRGWLEGGKMSAKLTNVLWADERVTVAGRVDHEEPEGTRTRVHCQLWADKDDGTRVLVVEASAVRI